MYQSKIVSADSHITEPANLFEGRLPARYAAMAPRLVRQDDGADVFITDGIPPFPITVASAAGLKGPKLLERMKTPYDECYRGGWDPRQRLLDQAQDGVDAEVLYPSLGMFLCRHEDGAFKSALFSAYNEWLAEFCETDPTRFIGLGQTAVESPEAGVADLRRIRDLGLRGVMMPGSPGISDYDDPIYDPLWEAAIDLDLPLSFHILSYKQGGESRGSRLNTNMNLVRGNQDLIGLMIFGGVFERFPKLKLVCAEADAGWAPHYMYRADHVLEMNPQWLGTVKLSRKPSEYFLENVWLTFQDDHVALKMLDMLNPQRLLWASDFPHLDSTYPNSRKVLADITHPLNAAQRDAFVGGNAASLYGLQLA